MRWLLGLALVAIFGLSFHLCTTEELTLYGCTVCLAEDPKRCATAPIDGSFRFKFEHEAREDARRQLCYSIHGDSIGPCFKRPPGSFKSTCFHERRRYPIIFYPGPK